MSCATTRPLPAWCQAQQLTRLDVSGYDRWDEDERCEQNRGVLAGKTQLQHRNLEISYGGAQLLSDLADLHQLTHLELRYSFDVEHDGNPPPAAAFAALTASSKLQYLHVRYCTLPTGVWQHVFPAGRQLPHLRELCLSGIRDPSIGPPYNQAPAPHGSLLVNFCPGLHVLRMDCLLYSAALLVPLQGLTQLQAVTLYGCMTAMLLRMRQWRRCVN